MFTNGTVLSIALRDAELAIKLLSEAERSFDGQDQPSVKVEARRRSSKPKFTAVNAGESRSFTVAAGDPCVE